MMDSAMLRHTHCRTTEFLSHIDYAVKLIGAFTGYRLTIGYIRPNFRTADYRHIRGARWSGR
jgi:hypothetical protein